MRDRPNDIGNRWIEVVNTSDGFEYLVFEVVARQGNLVTLKTVAAWGLHEVGPHEFCGLPVFGQIPMPLFENHVPDGDIEVELLMANETGGWTTDTFDIPAEVVYDRQNEINREAIVAWAEEHLGRQAQYRHIVAWQLYSISEDQFQEGPSNEEEDEAGE